MQSIIDILDEYVDAEREQTRSNLCVAYAAVGNQDAVSRLERICSTDASAAVRERAATELVTVDGQLRDDVVRRFHRGLFSSGDWLRSFELLQWMARTAKTPIQAAIGSKIRATLDLLRLNLRLRTTRSSPFFLFREFPFLALFMGVVISIAALLLWFQLVASGTDNQLGTELGSAMLSSYGLAIAFVMATPPKIVYLRQVAPYADVIWYALFCIVATVAFALLGEASEELYLVRKVPLSSLVVVTLMFLVAPIAAARLGVAVGTIHSGRIVSTLTAVGAGAGAVCLSLIIAVVLLTLFNASSAMRDAASTTSLYGISAAVLLSAFLGFAEPVGDSDEELPIRRRERWTTFAALALLFAIVSIMLAVPPSMISDEEAQKPEVEEPANPVSILLTEAPLNVTQEFPGGQEIVLEPEVDGNVDLVLTGGGDVMLYVQEGGLGDGVAEDDLASFSGADEIDFNGNLQPEETTRYLEQGHHYRVWAKYWGRDDDIEFPALELSHRYLWEFADRFAWWFGLRDASPWTSPAPVNEFSLQIGWTPDGSAGGGSPLE